MVISNFGWPSFLPKPKPYNFSQLLAISPMTNNNSPICAVH